jgi:hypothetical protein
LAGRLEHDDGAGTAAGPRDFVSGQNVRGADLDVTIAQCADRLDA